MTGLRYALAAYACLAVLALRPGPAVLLLPIGLAGLLALGGLWLYTLAGVPAERGVPALRLGLAALLGLLTLPLVALTLYGFGQPVRSGAVLAGAAVVTTLLAAGAAVRGRLGRDHPAEPGRALPVLAPTALALLVGAPAVLAAQRLPHPAPPGYLSVALDGWAAGIDRPVTVPAGGLIVPIRVRSAGLPDVDATLSLRIGGRIAGRRPLAVAADSTGTVAVRVPPLPAGCLQAVSITVGTAGTGFQARGAVPARPAAVRPAAVPAGRAAC